MRLKKRVILVVCGVVAAAVAIMLASNGNPGNMAICIACFVRDTAGAMKLQTNEKRCSTCAPKSLASLLALALAFGEQGIQGNSWFFPLYPLSFWFCNDDWLPDLSAARMVLRMAGGDLNAWVAALIGFAAGNGVGVLFLKKGFSLGRAETVKKAEGLHSSYYCCCRHLGALPPLCCRSSCRVLAACICSFHQWRFPLSLSARAFASPAACVTPSWYVMVGFVVIGILFAGVLIYNLASGHFNLSFADQPIARTDALWNILGMFVWGFQRYALGGCPLRQMVLAGSGSGDSAVTFIGLLVEQHLLTTSVLLLAPRA